MYVWQWSFSNEYVVIGRTWDQFIWLVDQISATLQANDRLLCFVHNLSFEFAYLRGIHRFSSADVFAVKARKILRAFWQPLEFRCSYLHSNMSLSEYLSKMGVEHEKVEEFDYSIIRYPWTELTEQEQQYIIHDVVGLVEAIQIEMKLDGDTLYTFPLTSTGYVRRDAKAAMRQVSYNFVHDQLPTLEVFKMLRAAFRGGDTHANRFYVGQIVNNVHSADRSSSYPDIVCNCMFPIGPFFIEKERMTESEVMKLITVRKRAVIVRAAFTDLKLRVDQWPAPYLSRDKCENIIGGQFDNGRVLCADYLETTLTDIDLQIVTREYKAKDIVFMTVAHARYGYLPKPLIAETIKYYKAKTELKGVEGQEQYYVKSKNKLNSIYGMMAQNPCKRSLLYIQDGVINKRGEIDYYTEDQSKTDLEILTDANKKAFLCYQWGCWVTAWARFRLRQGIWTVIDQDAEFLYCDTDSVKYIGTADWTAFNEARKRDSIANGAVAVDPSGEVHYMGVFEQEHDMLQFRTWGAKKYVYTMQPGKKWKKKHPRSKAEIVCTTAGVGKSAGADELEAAGGIKAYKPGFVFHEGGGLEAVYNDDADIWLDVEGEQLHITPNVTLRESSYTLGLAADFERLLKNYYSDIDF